MPDIKDFIARHKDGGAWNLRIYQEMELHLQRYQQIIGEMQSLKGTGGWSIAVPVPCYAFGVTVIDGDEPFIGPMGDSMMKEVHAAKFEMERLLRSGWGNLPLIQQFYRKIMDEPFPSDYQGIEIPPEYMTIDSHLSESGAGLLSDGK